MSEAKSARGLIFMSGRNCAAFVQRAIDSLVAQHHDGFDVLFVDDASTDGTGQLAREILQARMPGRHEVLISSERKGKARHAFEQLKGRNGHTYVAILDADDALQDASILGDMAQAYARGFDVVWTNYETDGGATGGNGPLDPWSSPRGQGWKTSHFFSFRQELIETVPKSYFVDEQGEWFQSACDFAIAYPVLDQTRRYLHIPRKAYRYTTANPLSHHNQGGAGLSSPQQMASARQVLAKPPLPLWRDLQTHEPSMQQALAYGLARTQEGLARCQRSVQALEQRMQDMPFQFMAVQQMVNKEGVPAEWLHQTGGWALDVGLLSHIAGVLDGYKAPRVLEFGSGRGSKTLARLVANRGGSLICVEHDPAWHARTSLEFEQLGLSTHARVEHCPLVSVDFFNVPGMFYDMPFLPHVAPFDVVIVDGPPARTCPMVRLPALPMMAPHLSPDGFHVFLDDYEREEEQAIVKVWCSVVPELKLTELSYGKGVAQLTPP
jgi:predicted O-methyltransferase YrrM